MKTFLLKFFRFAVIFAFFCVFLFSVLFLVIEMNMGEKGSIRGEYESIIVGNSMPQTSLNDTFLPKTLNCAGAGHYTVISYYKIRKILTDVPSVKYVFLTFGPWVEDDAEIRKASFIPGLDGVLPCLSPKEFITLDVSYHAKLRAIQGAWRNVLKQTDKEKGSVSLWGGFLPISRNRLDVDLKRRQMYTYTATFKPSRYFKEIQRLCQQKGVQLFFLETPVYRRDAYFPDADVVRQRYFPEVVFWRFGTVSFPDTHYGDITHLNAEGAQAFTPLFRERLNQLRGLRTIP